MIYANKSIRFEDLDCVEHVGVGGAIIDAGGADAKFALLNLTGVKGTTVFLGAPRMETERFFAVRAEEMGEIIGQLSALAEVEGIAAAVNAFADQAKAACLATIRKLPE
jgi:hypothetical protein